eukprot:TRINITY_DN1897_c0_g1_i10.p2 TRINITY_DN1897_c0_g1~~TRINITY_DN1897_c0_g1_i10.p2  ORF type:complete len:239 (-),score=-5.78 TRINITY_DN1897_c0_g1_i10:56-772(-)
MISMLQYPNIAQQYVIMINCYYYLVLSFKFEVNQYILYPTYQLQVFENLYDALVQLENRQEQLLDQNSHYRQFSQIWNICFASTKKRSKKIIDQFRPYNSVYILETKYIWKYIQIYIQNQSTRFLFEFNSFGLKQQKRLLSMESCGQKRFFYCQQLFIFCNTLQKDCICICLQFYICMMEGYEKWEWRLVCVIELQHKYNKCSSVDGIQKCLKWTLKFDKLHQCNKCLQAIKRCKWKI